MGYDDVLSKIGGFGRHQWKLYFLFSFPVFINVFFKIGNVLIVTTPPYRCKLPFEFENASYELNDTTLRKWYPYNNSTMKYSSCFYYSNHTEVKCDKFVFSQILGKTLAVDFELTCEKDYLIASTNSASMLGFILGSFLFGNASDRWGRKRMFVIANFAYLLLGTITIYSPNIWVFLVLKILIGLVVSGTYYTGYVLLIESTVPERRVLAGTSMVLFYCPAVLVASLLGYLSPSWKYLDIFYTMFAVPCLIYVWVVPESARWLITKRKLKQAEAIIRDIAKENKVYLQEDQLETLLSITSKDKTIPKQAIILDALKYPTLRKRIFFILCLNFSFLVYFGIVWNVGRLNGNLYLNLALLGASDVPAFFLTLIPGQQFGRKPVLLVYCITSGICFILMRLKPLDSVWVLVWTLIAKACLGSAINLSYVYSSEIYPTVLRNAGLGLNSLVSGIGAIMSPYIFYLSSVWGPLPNAVYAATIISGGLMCLLLPETLNKKLPESLQEGDSFKA